MAVQPPALAPDVVLNGPAPFGQIAIDSDSHGSNVGGEDLGNAQDPAVCVQHGCGGLINVVGSDQV